MRHQEKYTKRKGAGPKFKTVKPGQRVVVEAYKTGKGAEGWIIKRDKFTKRAVTTVSSAKALDEATATYASALRRLAKK